LRGSARLLSAAGNYCKEYREKWKAFHGLDYTSRHRRRCGALIP
jgi:hypothetical protein